MIALGEKLGQHFKLEISNDERHYWKFNFKECECWISFDAPYFYISAIGFEKKYSEKFIPYSKTLLLGEYTEYDIVENIIERIPKAYKVLERYKK